MLLIHPQLSPITVIKITIGLVGEIPERFPSSQETDLGRVPVYL